MTKKEIVKNLGEDIAILLHTGLRKWCTDPQSSIAWRAIARMNEEEWKNLCETVAGEVYEPMRKAFKEQFNVLSHKKD